MIRPSRREFRELARSGLRVPVAAAVRLDTTAGALFQAAGFSVPHLLLESARSHPLTGRYSFILGEPVSSLTAKGERIALRQEGRLREFSGRPLSVLQELLDAGSAVRVAGFPPFVGGAAGFFGFDCARLIEPLPAVSKDDLGLPDLGFLFFDQAIALDHPARELWAIVLAGPADDPDRGYDEAVGRAEALLKRAARSPSADALSFPRKREPDPRFREDDRCAVSSTHTRLSFEEMVRQAKRFIADGEIYQANLSQRFSMPLAGRPWDLYRRLRAINPSPFACFADFGSFQVVSASPERFLRVRGRCVETRPIAGTRPQGRTAAQTAVLRRELILNEKERAEHLMLVDLERNDLGRVCRYGSVRVDEMMALEEYSHVIHIVSNVRGILRPKVRPAGLIAAAFPGGTITGCPKIRSIEIIDRLEPVRRQLYTGSLGYLSADGEMDLNLLIRTGFVAEGKVHVQAGAGIVADSDPGREYEETLHKAQALMEAFSVRPELVEGRTEEPVHASTCSA